MATAYDHELDTNPNPSRRAVEYAELGGRVVDSLHAENNGDPTSGSRWQRSDEYVKRIAQFAGRIADERRRSLPVVVIPCGARKVDHAAPAGELYTGGLFTMALRAARTITTDDRIRILSGRHGLVTLDTVLEPYEQRIDTTGAITAAEIALQALELPAGTVVALLPQAYAAALDGAGVAFTNPLAGSRGIGDQRGRLSAITRGDLAA